MDDQPSRRLGEWLKMGLSGPVLSNSRRILSKDGQNPTDKITLRYFVIHYRSTDKQGEILYYYFYIMSIDNEIAVQQEAGSGRAFFVLYDENKYCKLARHLVDCLASKSKAVLIRLGAVHDRNWREMTKQIQLFSETRSIRQASVVAFGAAAAVAQNLALSELKSVRSLVLVDATTRPHPDMKSRVIDWIEQHLPLGLPLRRNSESFDSKPFLHRIRCPVLVVLSRAGNSEKHIIDQAAVLNSLLPTAWRIDLGEEDEALELGRLAVEFQEVPAKAPLRKAAGGN